MGDAFPNIAAPEDDLFSQYPYKAQVISRFENGTVQSAGKHTKKRWVFELGWGSLPSGDYDDLVDHFDENVGDTFPWTHPLTAASHTVRYRDNNLPKATPHASGNYYRMAGLILEEA